MKSKIKLIMLFLALFAIRANCQITIDSIKTTNASSCSVCNGSAIAYVRGSHPPFRYYWSNLHSYNYSHKDSDLCPGTYYLVVQDSIGDTTGFNGTFTIGPPSIALTIHSTNSACVGNTGTATVNATGGAPPYTYHWTPGGGTTATITGLSSGTYSVTVTDHNGCTQGDSVHVGENHLFDSLNIVNTTCAGNNGSARVTVSGGTAPYTYVWSPGGQTTATATGLTAGSYTVTVTDHNGCSLTTSAVISSTGPVPTIVKGNDSCNGQSNGFAKVNSVSGGVAPYTYLWAPSGNTTDEITGLSAGNYTVTVTDRNGCSSTTLVAISQPAPLSFTDTTTADTGGCTGGAWIIVSGGTGPYTFTWSPNIHTYWDTLNEQQVDSLCAGSYLVCITDANGCTTCDSVHVRHVHTSGIGNIKENAGGIKVYPDPVSDRLNIITQGLESATYSILVYDMIGRQVLQNNNVTINQGEGIQVNVSGLPAGKYMLRLSNATSNKIAPFIVTH